ncbi:DDT domain-containing protein DDR4 [Phalaenopsis equestris]|uniref:DDT domain-containing protein DDR4 n=1 Tax=Phalaenopsis equestris TaxID=78828 RepID=UPI0009E250F6|nr:DDT domain-containing protein DDR4 [Phalaenopsis equestris]
MTEGRRHLRSSTASECIPEKLLPGDMTSDLTLIDEQLARTQLRQRWELAFVLNFFRIFRPLIPKDLKIPAEEIETALIEANKNLGRIHIALLKGVPPIDKRMTNPDAWITSVCKKLATWWSWIAEGKIPLRADRGREIPLYKQLDPTTRLLILKALCDVRAEQDDILEFIADGLKKGNSVGFFRKEGMEVGNSGVIYWYEGDSVIGHRLYREIGKTYSKQNAKGKDFVEPTFESQWETIATNLEEISGIMDSLSSSKISGEASVGETLKTLILPVFEKIEKKKARKQRLARLLEGSQNCRHGPARSCRNHRPPIYTFDMYDRSIDEALRTSDPNYVEPRKRKGYQYENDFNKQYPSLNGRNMDTLNEISGNDGDPKSSEVNNDVKNMDDLSNYDDEDDDCEAQKDGAGLDDGETLDSEFEKKNTNASSKPAHEKNHSNDKIDARLRRSSRIFNAYHAVTKKRLRERPTKNAGYNEGISSDSEHENPTKRIKQNATDLSYNGNSPINIDSNDESQKKSGEYLS